MPRAACQCVFCFVPDESWRNGPTGAGVVARAYTMSAMPAMTTIAVSPYHHVLLRDRFADRTAARLRFAREAFVTTSRLVAGRVGPRCTPGVLGHREGASRSEIHG